MRSNRLGNFAIEPTDKLQVFSLEPTWCARRQNSYFSVLSTRFARAENDFGFDGSARC